MSPRAESLDIREPAIRIGVAAVLTGLCLAAWDPWTSDDAFISFRYARNLVLGHGLVYNIGERVEGYTNLLWTLWLALGIAIRVDPVTWSAISGLACYAAVLVLLFAFHLELRKRLQVARWTVPVACLLAALHPDSNVFATSGLETSAFTATALAGYFVLATGLISGHVRPLLAGTLLGVATMLRPDGMVFVFVAFVVLVVVPSVRAKDVVLFAVAAGFFIGGTTVFRLGYYGDYFPNTYYAKSAMLPWHRQGLSYLTLYLHKYWVLFVGPIGVVWQWWSGRRLRQDDPAAWTFFQVHGALATAFAGAYTYYVVRVGGDFMYARLLIPVTPYLAILLELALRRLSLVRPIAYAELVFAGLALPLVTPRPVTGKDWLDGIADERAVYDSNRVSGDDEKSKVLASFFRDLPVRMAFLGTEARIMYEAAIPVAIEADTGLTDRTIARQPLSTRGRIGHEKRASVQYLVGERGAHFMLTHEGPEVLGLAEHIPLTRVKLGPVSAWILSWDPALMGALRQRGAVFPDFEEYLDQYLATLETKSDETVARDYRKFRLFYFDHVQDRGRQAAFQRRLAP